MKRDPLERVEVEIGGRAFTGWTQISVSISVEQASRTASIQCSDFEGRLSVSPGDECTIKASDDLLLTGYVRDKKPSHSENEHRVDLSIVSRAIDAVEASIDHPTGFVTDKDLIGIAEEFDTSGVGIVANESFPIEAKRFVRTGESLFYHIEGLARSHAALIYDTPEGELRIAKKPRGRHSGALSIGENGNIISASAVHSEQGRHDETIVRGQSSKGVGDAALRIEARGKDKSVKRKRPIIIVHESEASADKLKERAERRAKRAAGYSTSGSVVVSGWRDGGGKLFEPHFTIHVNDPRIDIEQDMAIKTLTLTQDITQGGPGTRASLTLVDPAALNGESGGSGQWETPDEPATVNI